MSVIDSRFTLDAQFDVKRIEEVVRQYWREANIEGKWHEGPKNATRWFTFLEGPPTTNAFHTLAILGVGRTRTLYLGTIGYLVIGFGLRVVGTSRDFPWRLRLRKSLA